MNGTGKGHQMKHTLTLLTALLLAPLAGLHAAERPAAAKVAPSSDVTRESLAVSDGHFRIYSCYAPAGDHQRQSFFVWLSDSR